MKELSKKILSTLTAVAMIFTIFASPVGEIFGFVGETVKASAASVWSNSNTYGYFSSDPEALKEVKNAMSITTSSYFMQRFEKILSDYPVEGYFNSYKTKGCSWHCAKCSGNKSSSSCISTFYDDEISDDVNLHASQCWGFARYCFYRFHHINLGDQSGQVDVIKVSAGFTAESIKKFLDENAVVGAHIRCNSRNHSMVYLSHDDSYIYLIDANSGINSATGVKQNCPNNSSHWRSCCKINLRKLSYAKLVGLYGDYEITYTVPKEVKIDLTSAPNNLGTQFVAPIKVTSTGKVLTAGSDGNVTVQTWTGADNQKWTFTKNSGDNYYEIKNVKYNKNLDVADGSDKDGANLQIWEDNDTASQRFGIYGSQGNYIIKVKYSSGRVIDSDGGNSNVHMWTYYKDLAAQKFTIEADPNPTFSNVKASSITNDNAIISATAHKKPSTTALKFRIAVWPKDTGLIGSVTALMQLQTFAFDSTRPNQGGTTNTIEFNLKSEGTISEGKLMTLSPDTEYNYYITSYYNEGGVTVSYDSDTYTFKTTNTCSHTFGSWVTKTPATCTADGLKQRTCTKNCGKVESAVITKLGHSYTSSVTKAATCTATGVRTYKCSRCTSSYTESIAKTGHSYTTGYEAVHPHKNYKKCTVCSTVEYTGTTQYLCSCLSCTNLVAPTITVATTLPNINKEVTFSWVASPKDKLAGYWVQIAGPDGNMFKTISISKDVNSYTFTPTMTGEYKIAIAATPTGSPDGTGSLWGNATITVHDIARYYEATHPHKYVDYCKNCDYMVYVGTNLGYYEKCKTCHDSVAPSKPVVKNVASSYVVGDSIIVKWDATTNTTHYNIHLWKKDETGEYKSIEWVPYAENGHTFTGYGVGEYGISIQSYNSGYFYQYSETYRDWVHTSSDSVRFTIKPEGIKNFSVTSKTANTVTLGWTANTTATGYIIQQMKSGKWTNIANISNNATTTYTVSGLAASTSYSFRAVAYATANGSNIYSSYTASTPAITLPASITGFAITGRDSSSLTLSWAKNTSADGYVIQQQVNGAWSNIAVLKSNATVTYKVTELDPNAFYRFRMVAFKSHDGTKLYSKYTGAMSGYTAPAMVSGLKVVTDSENQLTVSWSKVDSANGYVLDIYKDGKWTEVARYQSNGTLKYVATGLTAGTQYKFRIKSYAVNNSLTIYSTYSSPVIAVTKPAQVTGFKITANGSNSVSLSWNKMNASGYVIQALKNNEWVTVGNIKDGTVTSYTVTGLTANSSYKFRMVAYATVNNTSVYGKYTAALAGRTAPAKVTNLTMTNRGTDFISVRWDKNEKADGYMIYLYDGTKWTCVKTMTSNSAVSHKITGLASGKNYKITVKAIKTVDNVKYVSDSVTISATTL